MISRPLIDLINSGRAVSITGSGISADAGIPTWTALLELVADTLQAEERCDTAAARALASSGRLPDAFQALADAASRSEIHDRVATIVNKASDPGRYHIQLADWPFCFYITTNYDHLLEDASRGRLASVGNRGAELHKIGGGNAGFVWHLHGGCRLASAVSSLVVARGDYEDYYPSSNAVDKLKASATSHQCVFVGFGFQDDDLNYVLKAIGRLGNSGLPHFAFIAYSGSRPEMRDHQARLRADYNVEAIPYFVRDGDHSDLRRVLATYEPFIVRHSISLGRPPHTTPTYDAIATSLNVQAGLDIGILAQSGSLTTTLVGARVVAHIRAHPGGTEDELEPIYRSGAPSRDEVLDSVRRLRESGAATPPPHLDLTANHSKRTDEAKAQLALTRQRFCQSLRARMSEGNYALDQAAQSRVLDAGAAFVDRLCRERGLGVAQNLATSNVDQASRRTVALIRHLPDHLAECRTPPEAQALVHLVTDILTAPREAEATFLGLLCQAYFGQHLVGASDTLAQVDLSLIGESCYVLDSSVLVCLLASGGRVQKFANDLIVALVNCGAVLTTTELFLEETAEHARWAADFVKTYGEHSDHVIGALQSLGGYTSNEFLQAYFLSPREDASFESYMRGALNLPAGGITDRAVARRLSEMQIETVHFDQWRGFERSLQAKMKQVCAEIEARRVRRRTFKHGRQIRAEAEVALIVDGVRSGQLQPPGGQAKDAYFVSNTRVVDELPDLDGRICLLPEGLAQWLWSAKSTSTDHAELVFQQLLWELAQGGIEFVDRGTLLQRFSGVVEAAEADLEMSIGSRREYLVEKYGAEPAEAFREAEPLELPRMAVEVRQEALARMEAKVADAREREREAGSLARLNVEERTELARLRAKTEKKRRKAEARRLAAKRKSGRQKKRKKRKT